MDTNIDAKVVTNTLNGLRVQTNLILGRPNSLPERSTINEQLNIMTDLKPGSDQKPEARYMTIGNRGHSVDMSDPTLIIPFPVQHRPTDVGAWGPIPFVLRPVANDLADSIRGNYALRTLEVHDNQQYWAYYAKRLDHSTVTTQDWELTVSDGVQTVKEFYYADAHLHSKPPVLPNYNFDVTDQIVLADGKYVYTNATIKMTLDENDIKELINVAKIKYKDPRKAIVSEFILCSGVDHIATGESFTSSAFQYMEVAGLQAIVFLNSFNSAALSNVEIGYDVVIGQTEPMPIDTGATVS